MLAHEAWLFKADNDLKTAKKLIRDPEDVILDTSIYHTQQAAEKALKAYLAFKLQPIQKVHDLEYLVKICSTFDIRFKKLAPCAKLLQPYCFDFRYPDDILLPDLKEVQEALVCAEKIVHSVKNIIKEPQDSTLSIFE